MSDNSPSLWKCEFENIDTFTVGEKKKLTCEGNYIEQLVEPIHIVAAQKDHQWILHPLELISSEPESLSLIVTSYKAGQFSNFQFAVIDAMGKGFQVEPLSWEVQSVIENPQNPQGFGPSHPLSLPIPPWFWWGWALAAIWIAVIVFYKWFLGLKRKNVIRGLSTYKTLRSPYNQYHWEMRKLAREYQTPDYVKKSQAQGSAKEYLLEMDRSLRLYFVRQLRIPALDWGCRQVFTELKHYHKPIFKKAGGDIQKILSEFEKAVATKKGVDIKDCYQFHQMSRDLVERVNSLEALKK